MSVDVKLKRLKKILKELGSCVVAFSGGLDSSLILAVARKVLGDKVLAVIALSETYPKDDLLRAKALVKRLRVRHIIIKTSELKNKKFLNNPPRRCYWCKKELYRSLVEIARKKKMGFVVDGTNFDDQRDFRPGRIAAREFRIISPLKLARFTKEDIRQASRGLGLREWKRPASPCLASRIPYGVKITLKGLARIGKAEEYLRSLGFKELRARSIENGVRIEVSPDEIKKVAGEKMRKKVVRRLKRLGFNYVTLDLQGFRSGSLNEVITR